MKDLWKGRFDSNELEDLRLWQVIRKFDDNISQKSVCFVGYDTDDGVIKNQGRSGAKDGSNAIRKALQSLPNIEGLDFYDYGNLKAYDIQQSQEEYSTKITKVIKAGSFPIGLGGGHDISYGSYLGVRKAYPHKKIAMINLDTHLDMRPYEKTRSSGTAFKQILDEDKNTTYSIIGFKKEGNTQRLRNIAKEHNVLIFDSEDVDLQLDNVLFKIEEYLSGTDIVYLTICMDVFDVSFAPGVSAPSIMGLEPKQARMILRKIFESKKVVCLDVAEVNPKYDIDNRTSRLAAALIYDILLGF